MLNSNMIHYECFSCGKEKVLKIKNFITEKNNLKFIFEEKFLLYGKLRKFDKQLFTYILRIYDYLIDMNFQSEEINLLKMDMIFLNKENSIENKLNFVKTLMKTNPDYQNNLPIWLNYYNWCIFLERYDDAEKIIKLLNAKLENNKEANLEIKLKIKYSSLFHYVYYMIREKDLKIEKDFTKYKIKEFFELFENTSRFIFEILSTGSCKNLSKKELVEKLENILLEEKIPNPNFYLLVLSLVTLGYLVVLNFEENENFSLTREDFFKKIKLISTYVNVLEIRLNNYNIDKLNNCPHLFKQNVSISFVRIFSLVKLFNKNFESKNLELGFLECLNNFNNNSNDFFIFLFTKCLCYFSNPVDREIKFLSQYENIGILNLKHSYYFLRQRYLNSNNELENISLLHFFKEFWNLTEKNLNRPSLSFFKFDFTKKLTTEKNYSYQLNAKISSSSKLLIKYLDIIIDDLNKDKIKNFKNFIDYSLFTIHEYPYSKIHYLKFFERCVEMVPNLNEEKLKTVRDNLKDFFDLMKIKEVRLESTKIEEWFDCLD